jgi:phosphoribosyl-AMP cyclohydrolase / phosphoribosyl-ATP pyrophosphohydrolase
VSLLSLPEGLAYDAGGLIPVVVQDRASGDVLMLAYANAEALARTAETGLAHFWSRSRRALWRKGKTSGHSLRVRALRTDCDRDALLMVVDPAGPACHTGTRACFGDSTPTEAGLPAEIERVIAQRAASGGEKSYTVRLLARGLDHALKKVGEEATEFVLAAKGESDERLAEEGADLLFHLMVVLAQRGVPVVRLMDVLRERRSHP